MYTDLYNKTIAKQAEYLDLSNKTIVAFQKATKSTEDVKLAWCINILLQHPSNEAALRPCDVGIHDDYIAHNFSPDMTHLAIAVNNIFTYKESIIITNGLNYRFSQRSKIL